MASYDQQVRRLQAEIQSMRRETDRRIEEIERAHEQKLRRLQEQYADKQQQTARELADVRRQQQTYRHEMESAISEIEHTYEQQFKAKNDELKAAIMQLRQERERIQREEREQSEANRQEAETRLAEAHSLHDAIAKRPHERLMPGQLSAVNNAITQAEGLLKANLTTAAAGVAGSATLELELFNLQLDEEVRRFQREYTYVRREVDGMIGDVDRFLVRNDIVKDDLTEQDFTSGALNAACSHADALKSTVDQIHIQGEAALHSLDTPVGVDLTNLHHTVAKEHEHLDLLLDTAERERLSAIHRQSMGCAIVGELEQYGYQLAGQGFCKGDVLLPYVVAAAFAGVSIRFVGEAVRTGGVVTSDRLTIQITADYLEADQITALAETWRQRLQQVLGGRVQVYIGNSADSTAAVQNVLGDAGGESTAIHA